MKLTPEEIAELDAEVNRMLNRIHELSGSAIVILVEREHDDGTHTIRFGRRGSPYSCCRMAQIYAKGEDNEDLAGEIARCIVAEEEGGE